MKKQNKKLIAWVLVIGLLFIVSTNLANRDPNKAYFPVEEAEADGRMADVVDGYVSFDGYVDNFQVTVSGHDESNLFVGDDIGIVAKVYNPGSTGGSDMMYVQCSVFLDDGYSSAVGREGFVDYYLTPESNCQGFEPYTQTAYVFVNPGETYYVPFVVTAPVAGDYYVYCGSYERCWTPTQDPYVSSEDWTSSTITVNEHSECSYWKCWDEDLWCYNQYDQRMTNYVTECSAEYGCDESSNQCITCSTHDHRECYNGDPYYYDSCDNRENIADFCEDDETCVNGACTGGVVFNRHHTACYDGDIWWYDPSNNLQDKDEDCGTNTCEMVDGIATCVDGGTPEPWCGDTVCNGDETVTSCPVDCSASSEKLCYKCDGIEVISKPLSQLGDGVVGLVQAPSCAEAYPDGDWSASASINCSSGVVDGGGVVIEGDSKFFINENDPTQWCVDRLIGGISCFDRKPNVYTVKEGASKLEDYNLGETYLATINEAKFFNDGTPLCVNRIGDMMCQAGGECIPAKNSESSVYKTESEIYAALEDSLTVKNYFLTRIFTIGIVNPKENTIEEYGMCMYEQRDAISMVRTFIAELFGLDPDSKDANYAFWGVVAGTVILLFLLLRPPRPRAPVVRY